jgi:NAD(P)-dependent dehydrogenase (short-subunit alcohol dehydrogenase family)
MAWLKTRLRYKLQSTRTMREISMSEDILSGGVAVITGAASGIGNGIARAAAARGMKLVLADIAAEALQAFAAELEAAGVQALAVPTDVTDPAAIDALAARTHEHFGDVRLLVNNAGIEMLGLAWELSAAQWERIVRINILGPIHGTRAFAGAMVKSGKPGFIANVSSLGGLAMMPEQTPYILSKHATLSPNACFWKWRAPRRRSGSAQSCPDPWPPAFSAMQRPPPRQAPAAIARSWNTF